MEQFDTAEEFRLMSRAGMSFQKILASLTTNPAERFGYSTIADALQKEWMPILCCYARILRRT
jgi:hypothetical protein